MNAIAVVSLGIGILLPALAAHGQGIRGVTRRVVDPPPAFQLPADPPPRPQPIAPLPAPEDPAKAAIRKAAVLKSTVEWQKKRAEHGSPSAQYDLGVRYLTGDGVERNPALARKWLQAAATNGNRQAATKLSELKKLEASPPPRNDGQND
jgi:TPR repeat protein